MTPPPSDHFNGKTFFLPQQPGPGRLLDLLRWRLGRAARPWPRQVTLPTVPPPPRPEKGEVVVTWLGHASFLLQTTHGNLLIDPVFSERASPVSWAGPRRVHPVPLAFADLPEISAVLLSHDHYDHFDAGTLRRLVDQFQPVFIAPLRHGDLLARVRARDVRELDWWDATTLWDHVTVTLTPTRHWSNRLGTPRNHRLWGGYFLSCHAHEPGATGPQVWFVGDTGHAPQFTAEVRRRLGSPDLALVPIGAYEPRWFMAPMHMNPAEAVELHRASGAARSVAMHWGTFNLSDEGRDDPPADLAAALQAAGIPDDVFLTLDPGRSLAVGRAIRSGTKT